VCCTIQPIRSKGAPPAKSDSFVRIFPNSIISVGSKIIENENEQALKSGDTASMRVLFVAPKLVSNRVSFGSNVACGLVAISNNRLGAPATESAYSPWPADGLFIPQWDIREAPAAGLAENASPAIATEVSHKLGFALNALSVVLSSLCMRIL
jgi:hypothetical protein